ncbi:serine/threonine protein kinase [Streptomyces sp. AJS327]|uniref:serine/threonine-protein kinase n=1 Tax=Streptomyces sp. AJS327 TaxID=2545265 RepID=UPI0015DF9249|nr:serine/threonine-protein kinase [Streptomyces sp. AJS327]MBA0053005.1 serine/threonine protein kinase [Streptomyces sp. AJS327]
MTGRSAEGEGPPVGTGTVLGGYRLLSKLGAGGMGQVYLARSEGGRTVAVKLIKAELAVEAEFRARFRQEVRAARLVDGAWTAPVLDADTEAHTPWVATGYIAGSSLDHVVSGSGHGPLPADSMRTLGHGLASALADIHRAELVHRDLKPSNVLITIDGPRVIDFGIARALDAVPESTLTRTGMVLGSPAYMSPEQIRGEQLSAASDVFSMGSILVYAATGRSPFGGQESGNIHSLMYRITQGEPDLGGLQEPVRTLAEECLAKEAAMRPTAEEVAERLRPEETGVAIPPWLPAELIAELGRHAVRLLDTDTPPSGSGAPGRTPEPARSAAAEASEEASGEPGTRIEPSSEAPTTSVRARGPAADDPGAGDGASAPPRRGARRGRLLLGLAAGALVLGAGYAVGSEVLGTSNQGGGGSAQRESDVPKRFLGTWTGVVERGGEPTGQYRRFVITPGERGELVARSVSLGRDYSCDSDGKLASSDPVDGLRLDTRVVRSVPEGKCSAIGEHTLRPGGGGTLEWEAGGRTATLRKVTGEERLSAELLGEWRRTLPNGGTQTMTVQQAAPGKRGVRLVSEGGGEHCEATMTLFSAGDADSPVRLGPPALDREASDGACVTGASSTLRVENGQLIREFPDGRTRTYVPADSPG